MITRAQTRKRDADEKGRHAERVAERCLIKAGYQIVARRLKTKRGELDHVALSPRCLVFVEVKARRTFDDAAYAIRPAQQVRLVRAAELVCALQPEWRREETRFDAILVDARGEVCWLKDILTASTPSLMWES